MHRHDTCVDVCADMCVNTWVDTRDISVAMCVRHVDGTGTAMHTGICMGICVHKSHACMAVSTCQCPCLYMHLNACQLTGTCVKLKCVSAHRHMCKHMSMHMSIHMYEHMCEHMHTHMFGHVSVHTRVHGHMPTHGQLSTCLSACMRTCPHTCLNTCLSTGRSKASGHNYVGP